MDKLINLLSKYKNALLNVAIIALALVISKNIYQNQAKEISTLMQLKESAQKKNAALEDISQLQKKFAVFRASINNKDIAIVMGKISDIAKEYGIKILSVRPLPDKDCGTYTAYAFDLNITSASYHNLGKFISKLESSPDIYYITNLNMARREKDEFITVGMTVNTMWVKD